MTFVVDQQETQWTIRCGEDAGVAFASELKSLLLEGLASGKELQLNFEQAGEIDISVLQLLLAAEREAAQRGTRMVCRPTAAMVQTARDAGWERVPGDRDSEASVG